MLHIVSIFFLPNLFPRIGLGVKWFRKQNLARDHSFLPVPFHFHSRQNLFCIEVLHIHTLLQKSLHCENTMPWVAIIIFFLCCTSFQDNQGSMEIPPQQKMCYELGPPCPLPVPPPPPPHLQMNSLSPYLPEGKYGYCNICVYQSWSLRE